jgi:hypothetical protein
MTVNETRRQKIEDCFATLAAILTDEAVEVAVRAMRKVLCERRMARCTERILKRRAQRKEAGRA